MKRIKEVNILNADENSIVVMHVDIAGFSGITADKYLERLSRKIEPMFKKKGVDFMILPFRDEKFITFEVIKKDGYAKIMEEKPKPKPQKPQRPKSQIINEREEIPSKKKKQKEE